MNDSRAKNDIYVELTTGSRSVEKRTLSLKDVEEQFSYDWNG